LLLRWCCVGVRCLSALLPCAASLGVIITTFTLVMLSWMLFLVHMALPLLLLLLLWAGL
jgi:hypothetical protein